MIRFDVLMVHKVIEINSFDWEHTLSISSNHSIAHKRIVHSNIFKDGLTTY